MHSGQIKQIVAKAIPMIIIDPTIWKKHSMTSIRPMLFQTNSDGDIA